LDKHILVLTTAPEEKSGQTIATHLLEERLAACVTISPASQSLYWWKEKIAKEPEHILFIKTRAALYPELEKKIREIHPYEVPEIIVLPIQKGSTEYLNWIDKETKS
jgi:periplasmic divalent cation tolerance protein